MNKKILVGITGSVSAYKTAELVHQLVLQGNQVKVVMTKGGEAFIKPLTLQALSGHPVYQDMFLSQSATGMDHIELARWANIIIIMPASANFISRLSHAFADDLLTTICLATKAPIFIVPSMNQQMWNNSLLQKNVARLIEHGVQFWGPAAGLQACGDNGEGRMLEPETILEYIATYFHSKKKFCNQRFLITAGPTRENIDPVRFISNHSSGKMGYALAKAAAALGAEICLISGPTELKPISDIELIIVTTADEMYHAVMSKVDQANIFISTAAVCDYKIAQPSPEKIKKNCAVKMALDLTLNRDIIATVAQLKNKPFTVGFAAETCDVIGHAKQKLIQKNLDMIVANDVRDGQGFYVDENQATILMKDGSEYTLPKMSKTALAEKILERLPPNTP